MHLERLDGSRRRPLAPQRVDQPLRWHRLARVQEQHGEQRPLLRSAQLKLTAVLPDRKRPQDPELHPPNVTPVTSKLQSPR